MNIILSYSSAVPIYVQIMDQIKKQIADGVLLPNDILPSVRSLSAELKISALTVKKAYDNLEDDGFVITVHGKGTYINEVNNQYILEERKKNLEYSLSAVIEKAESTGLSKDDIKEIFEMIIDE